MAITECLGEALKWLRNRRGWPQKQLAKAAGITRGMVSSYEKGRQIPTMATLEKLLTAMGADFCDLHCAVELVNGRPPSGHDLGEQFQRGPSKPSKPTARKQHPADTKERDLADETRRAPRLPEDLERALSHSAASVQELFRQILLVR